MRLNTKYSPNLCYFLLCFFFYYFPQILLLISVAGYNGVLVDCISALAVAAEDVPKVYLTVQVPLSSWHMILKVQLPRLYFYPLAA
ncbi:hypothetical protein ACOSQ2_019630 [Xanthoceras sorbifolium]